jgi:hypothetical protein
MRGITAVIVTLVIAAIVGVGAYQLGVAQGLAGAAAPTAVAPAFYYYHPFFFGGFGFLFPLLFIFLIFFLVRGLFWGWGGRRYGGWGRYGYGDPRDRLEEWHKQMHGEAPRDPGSSSSTTPPTGR